jgi:uncharacterized phiE125 gp8 family phage protein
MNRVIYTDATFEPLTLDEVKLQLKTDLDFTDEDNLYKSWIKAVRLHAENYLRMDLVQKTIDFYFDEFQDEMEIATYPIQSITHVKYYDGNNTLQTLTANTDYIADTYNRVPRIEIINMPTTYDKYNAVNIRAVCGYSKQQSIPENIKAGMLLLIAHFDQNREAVSDRQLYELPFGVKNLWDLERIYQF